LEGVYIRRGVLRAYVAFGVRRWTNVCSGVDKEGVLRSLRQTSALGGLICGCKSSLLSWMVRLFTGMSREFWAGDWVKGTGLAFCCKRGEEHGGPIISSVPVERQDVGIGSVLQEQP
jgi:hypothetical protein